MVPPAPSSGTFGHELRDDVDGFCCDHSTASPACHAAESSSGWPLPGRPPQTCSRASSSSRPPWCAYCEVAAAGQEAEKELVRAHCSSSQAPKDLAADLPPPASLSCPSQPLEKEEGRHVLCPQVDVGWKAGPPLP